MRSANLIDIQRMPFAVVAWFLFVSALLEISGSLESEKSLLPMFAVDVNGNFIIPIYCVRSY